MFVKIHNDIRTLRLRPYVGCVMNTVVEDRITYVIDEITGEKTRAMDYFNDPLYDVVDPSDVPEDLKDQVCYTKASDHIDNTWKWAKDEHGEVYKIDTIHEDDPMVYCIVMNECNEEREVRWDKLIKLDPDVDEVAGEDCLTGEPIFQESAGSTITLYRFSRYGRPEEMGEILPATINDHEDDVQMCDDCDRYYYTGDDNYDSYMYSDSYGTRHVCQHCFEYNDWCVCEDCGDLISADQSYEGDDGSWYCENCIERHRRGRLMHDYGYKPSPIFHSVDTATDAFMGVELEIDKGGDVNECLQDLDEYSDGQNLFYCKHDGSLDDGIEIVTHPCDIEFHLEKFPWKEITEAAKANGFKSHDAKTCGLHVHVSRDGFGATKDLQDLNIAKAIILVDRYWDELVNFSRRNYAQLDHWAKKPNAKIYSYDNEETAKEKAKASGSYDRYKAINLCNRNTVEFRLFRGSLEVETIKATLEFLDNLLNYVKGASLADVQETKWSDIVNFKEYPELKSYLVRRNLVDVPDKARPDEPKPVARRFEEGDAVWFETSNTNGMTRGIVQSVNVDLSVSQSPLYVVISGEGENERVNFLIDDEIVDNDTADELELQYQRSHDAVEAVEE